MYPPLRFGGRDALHPVGAGLELETRVDAATHDAADDLLEAAMLAVALAHYFDLPALPFGVP